MNYRNTRNYENLNKRIFKGVGPYEIPQIEATHFESCEFVGFNYAAQAKKREEKGIHFFLDDYQFERLWKTPDRYLSMLYDFKYVMTPDFSTYTDFPKIIQIYNHYRKIKEKDEVFEVSKERAEHLVKEGMVEIIKEGKETQK